MIDPPRLRDENPTDLERELLTAGSSYRSSTTARQKTLAALGLVGTAAASAGVAAAATTSVFPSSVVQKVAIWKLIAMSGLGVAVLTPVGFLAWQQFGPPDRPVVSVPAIKLPEAPPAERAQAPEAALPAEPAPAPAAEAPAPKADPRAASSGALTAELGVLDMARSKLAAGDARGALAVLDEYSRTYPRGRLDLEAQVLRIDALAKAGDTQAAKKRAEAFLKRYPKSVLASRVRRYLDEPR
jgi:hypothetical protein